MPLYAGSTPVAPEVEEVVNAWREDVGTIFATWTDPTGLVWPLTDIHPDRGYFTTFGIAGWGASPYEIVTDPHQRGGEQIRHIRALPARVTWPIHVWGETHQQFIDRYRMLRRAIMMTVHRRLPGILTVKRPDGSARYIEAWYEDGFTGEAGENWLSANPVVTFYCPDGAWRDVDQVVERRGFGTPQNFYSPFLTVSESQVIGATTITNPGDLTAWPEWTITGPCTSVSAINNSTGQSFLLTYTLTAGQTITITTDRPTVRGPAGENLVGALNWPEAFLWGLLPDANDVTFTVAGGSTGTEIELAFNPRYEGA